MMHLKRGGFGLLVFLAALCASSSHALTVTILADTNRDGRVDSLDAEGKNLWTDERGALFLPNIGDSSGVCSRSVTTETPWDLVDDCHDSADDVLRNADLLAPLRVLPIPDVKNCTRGALRVVTDEAAGSAADLVRVFVKVEDGEQWEYVSPGDYTFSAHQLAEGLELGIDARDVRRPGGWDGRVTVEMTVSSSDAPPAVDAVALRVAPVLVHHHGQQAERIFTMDDDVALMMPQFNDAVRKAARKVGIDEPVYGFLNIDKWVQDWFEPGYASIPGPDGEPVAVRVMLRSYQNRPSGTQVFSDLRTAVVGAVQGLEHMSGDTIDSAGNLEAVPPFTHGGRSWPAGRAYMGSSNGRLPHMFSFLQAQEAQDPIELDTSWLIVGHVDEFVQFLPAPDTERGWVVMVDDAMAGWKILDDAVQAGYGHVPGLSRPRMVDDPQMACLPNMTLSEVMALENLYELNLHAEERIEHNIDILKRETGITDDDIIRVPSLFYNPTGWNCIHEDGESQLARRLDLRGEQAEEEAMSAMFEMHRAQEVEQVIAHYPGVINGVVLTDREYLSPDPWGPIIEGHDILAEATKKAYAAAGYEVIFMDDWHSHHTTGGEVHCGTNVWRTTDETWW